MLIIRLIQLFWLSCAKIVQGERNSKNNLQELFFGLPSRRLSYPKKCKASAIPKNNLQELFFDLPSRRHIIDENRRNWAEGFIVIMWWRIGGIKFRRVESYLVLIFFLFLKYKTSKHRGVKMKFRFVYVTNLWQNRSVNGCTKCL